MRIEAGIDLAERVGDRPMAQAFLMLRNEYSVSQFAGA